ncbi:type III effector [Flavobacteriaceae bacterium R38]|nr:type III effector [Flavobacteriaceae bacterium R38]
MEKINSLLETVKSTPDVIAFNDVITLIDQSYHFTPVSFKNGDLNNREGENNGSCKILAFGKLTGLSSQETLHLFGDYYRKDVLENPNGTDHQNIRNFMKYGWEGILFENSPLEAK